jgi:TRAP transporter TAXI family solute receptor
MNLFRSVVGAIIGITLTWASAPSAYSQGTDRFFTFGSGQVKGIYFPLVAEVCRSVNQRTLTHGWRCGISASEGSEANLLGLKRQTLTFGIVQSNLVLATSEEDNSGVAVATVASLIPEPVHILVRESSSILRVDDLEGASINIGEAFSGTRKIAVSLLEAAEIEISEHQLHSYDPGSQARRLCEGDIDVVIWVSGIGNSSMTEAHRHCSVRLLDIPEVLTAQVLADIPGLTTITIPKGTYPNQVASVASFGPIARVVSREDTPEALVDLVYQALTGGIDRRSAHPLLLNLSDGDLAQFFPSEAVHPAVVRYR